MAIKIIVDTPQEKEEILKQSQYIHGIPEVDIAKTNTLAHLFVAPDCIEVKNLRLNRKKQQYITPIKGTN
jgi:hypothetical protein